MTRRPKASGTSARKVEIAERTTVFQGYFRIDRYRLRHALHEGGMSKELVREVFERGHAVGILLLDPKRWEVVLIEQFRIGAFAAGVEPWQIEIVAGIIDEGETPDSVAVRETREESGLDITDLWPIANYLVSPGGASEYVRLFLGRVDAGDAGGIHGLDDESEDIRVLVMPVAEAVALVGDPRLENALALISLQWLALHEDEVRARWRA